MPTAAEFKEQLGAELKKTLDPEYVDERLAAFRIEQQADDMLFIEEPESYIRGAWRAGAQLLGFVSGLVKSTAPPEARRGPDWDKMREQARERGSSGTDVAERRRQLMGG